MGLFTMLDRKKVYQEAYNQAHKEAKEQAMNNAEDIVKMDEYEDLVKRVRRRMCLEIDAAFLNYYDEIEEHSDHYLKHIRAHPILIDKKSLYAHHSDNLTSARKDLERKILGIVWRAESELGRNG